MSKKSKSKNSFKIALLLIAIGLISSLAMYFTYRAVVTPAQVALVAPDDPITTRPTTVTPPNNQKTNEGFEKPFDCAAQGRAYCDSLDPKAPNGKTCCVKGYVCAKNGAPGCVDATGNTGNSSGGSVPTPTPTPQPAVCRTASIFTQSWQLITTSDTSEIAPGKTLNLCVFASGPIVGATFSVNGIKLATPVFKSPSMLPTYCTAYTVPTGVTSLLVKADIIKPERPLSMIVQPGPSSRPTSSAYDIYSSNQYPPQIPGSLNCSATVSYKPAPSPSPLAACTAIKFFSATRLPLNSASFNTYKAGSKLYLCATGTGTITKARFTVNGSLRPEVGTPFLISGIKYFCDLYTIPQATFQFNVTAEIFSLASGWKQ